MIDAKRLSHLVEVAQRQYYLVCHMRDWGARTSTDESYGPLPTLENAKQAQKLIRTIWANTGEYRNTVRISSKPKGRVLTWTEWVDCVKGGKYWPGRQEALDLLKTTTGN